MALSLSNARRDRAQSQYRSEKAAKVALGGFCSVA
jgi:hypothetical protein